MQREHEVAYAAGVIDSDGTVGIHHKRSGGDCYEPRVAVRQVEPQAIDLLRELFQGCRRDAYQHGGPTSRPLYEWRATGRVACVALSEMMPFLRIKRAQAENAIEVGVLNRMQKFHEPLIIDDSEGLVPLVEAAQILGTTRQRLTSAVYRGQLPSVGWRATRRVPLATAREWTQRRPGGPTRPLEQTAELQRRWELARYLNRVGVTANGGGV